MVFKLDNDIIDNDYFNINLQRKNIQYILDFVLLWNLFERCFFNTRFKVSEIETNLSKFNDDKLEALFNYFYLRYISGNNVNDKFDKLEFERNEDKENVKNHLIEKTQDKKLYSAIFIIYRMRNNMFHGNKKIEFLEDQKENFEQANDFLRHVLESYSK